VERCRDLHRSPIFASRRGSGRSLDHEYDQWRTYVLAVADACHCFNGRFDRERLHRGRALLMADVIRLLAISLLVAIVQYLTRGGRRASPTIWLALCAACVGLLFVFVAVSST